MARDFKTDVTVNGVIVAKQSRTISTTSPLTGGGDLSANRTLAINDGTTAQKGAVQLTDATNSTSTTTAATPNSVKTAYDLAAAATPKTSPTIVADFSKAGTLATGTGTFRWYNDSGATLTLGTVRASVGTAPTGASLIVDVNRSVSGAAPATIYGTQANRPTIAVSTNTATGGAKTTTPFTLANGDYLTVDIDQVGSTVAGSDLAVSIWMSYA